MRLLTIDLERRHIHCNAVIPRHHLESNAEALKHAERHVTHNMAHQFAEFLAKKETEYDILRQCVNVRADFIVLTPAEFHALTNNRFLYAKRIEIPEARQYQAVFHVDGSPPRFGEGRDW